MSNQYFTFHSDLKNNATPPAQPKGVTAGYSESAKNWPAPPEGRGPRFNKVGFTEVKAYPSQRLNDDGGKIKKVMSEYKHGKLHSGSKEGPLVKDHDQAMAIAMSEAGMSKKKHK